MQWLELRTWKHQGTQLIGGGRIIRNWIWFIFNQWLDGMPQDGRIK